MAKPSGEEKPDLLPYLAIVYAEQGGPFYVTDWVDGREIFDIREAELHFNFFGTPDYQIPQWFINALAPFSEVL